MDQQPNDSIEQPALIHHDLPREAPKRPPLILAPIWLFFRPRNFFLHYVTEPVAALTVVFALLFGLARAIDKLDIKIMQGKLAFAADSWATYWMMAAISGVISGVFYFYLGGWWYRCRLKWCGAQDPDAQLARRLYLYACQIIAIPAVLITVIDSLTYSSPIAAMQSDSMWQLILIVFPFWSVFASYRGARALFEISMLRALIWFAFLPAIFYFIFLGSMVALFALSPAALNANLSSTTRFENSSLAFEYPGNWYMDMSDDYHDNESFLWIDSSADAYIWFRIYTESESLEEEFKVTLDEFEDDFGQTTQVGAPISVWSGFACYGMNLSCTYERTLYNAQIMTVSLGDEVTVDIVKIWARDELEYVKPGFDLIERTFQSHAN